MRTPEEIKHALKCCSEMEFPNDCNSCPYEAICTEEYEKQEATLGITLMRDVIAYIAQLEDQISHAGGTSTRAKCGELGFDPNQCVEFHRNRGDEE